MLPLAIYIHWPFCKAKCPYCDFNSHVTEHIVAERWKAAYIKEINYFAARVGKRNVSSIFFGGGTPSLMPVDLVKAIIDTLAEHFTFAEDIEITLEMNPTSIEAKKLEGFKAAGVNRVSVGIQSLRAKDLKFLGRQHSAEEALAALQTARDIFSNYSFDLIYARPNQTLLEWREELEEALQYVGTHFSLYQLTIEKGTPFYAAHSRGEFTLPDEDVAAEMYELTETMLKQKGLLAYEVSNYAKPGFECRHNLTYWQYGEYVGIGPGAHGRIGFPRQATMMIHGPEAWLKSVEEKNHGLQSDIAVTAQEIKEEAVMMGLRLAEGIDVTTFKTATGLDLWSCLDVQKLEACAKEGLITYTINNLRPTPKGRMLLSSLTALLLA
jgi:putative oxygen-independent coproporphyrinogen III oxidase